MNKSTHSPLPWVYVADPNADKFSGSIESADDWSVASVWCDVNELPAHANAEFIVRACNSHDDLLAALKVVTDALACQRDYELNNASPEEYAAVDAARAAIAKAEGRTA